MASRGGGGGDIGVWFFIFVAFVLMGAGVQLNWDLDDWFKTPSEELTVPELKEIPVATSPAPGYNRDRYFGDDWIDVDGNKCDTRNDILNRDLDAKTFDGPCVVTKGVLRDPYTGKNIDFVRGRESSSAVQIDHIVPLSYAWKYGANKWSQDQRYAFANDPRNLLAVDGPTNGAKSDKGISQFLPPNESYKCEYVENFIGVIHEYKLSMPQEDINAAEKVLKNC